LQAAGYQTHILIRNAASGGKLTIEKNSLGDALRFYYIRKPATLTIKAPPGIDHFHFGAGLEFICGILCGPTIKYF
jgi:hypothetical protein